MVGLMVISSKGAYAIPKSAAPRAPVPVTAHCWPVPYLHRGCPNTVLSQSLWGPWVLVLTRFVWTLWAFLAGMGFDPKCEFATPTTLLGLLYLSIYLNETEVPPCAINFGQVSSFTPQDSSVTKAPWVTVTDAQDHGDRAWVTSAGKCQDGMRSHPSPSLRTQSGPPFRRWASRAGEMVIHSSRCGPSVLTHLTLWMRKITCQVASYPSLFLFFFFNEKGYIWKE